MKRPPPRFLQWAALVWCWISLPVMAVTEYTVKVLEKKPQSRQNFVQGLEFDKGFLYVSSGNYGKSRLLRYDFTNNKLERGLVLDARVFAEGLTLLDDKLYQLTWRNRLMLVYQKETLQPLQSVPLPGDAWGLTNNGTHLIYTDGGDQLHYISPTSGKHIRSVAVTQDGRRIYKLNELEWIDGKIWANIWQSDRIVIIDPDSGEVSASIDLRGLLPQNERRPGTDVLNGIARDTLTGDIWVTGKHWPWLYKIELVPKPTAAPTRQANQPP